MLVFNSVSDIIALKVRFRFSELIFESIIYLQLKQLIVKNLFFVTYA